MNVEHRPWLYSCWSIAVLNAHAEARRSGRRQRVYRDVWHTTAGRELPGWWAMSDV